MVDKTGTQDLFAELATDMFLALEVWKEKKYPSLARAYVRAAFATVEGLLSSMKAECLAFHEETPGTFTSQELHFLNEYSYRIDERGHVVDGNDVISLKKNVRFTLSMYAKMERSSPIDYGVNGYRLFQEAIGIRNRVTHPKTINDIRLSAEDMKVVDEGLAWFQAIANDLMGQTTTRTLKKLQKLVDESGLTSEEITKILSEGPPGESTS